MFFVKYVPLGLGGALKSSLSNNGFVYFLGSHDVVRAGQTMGCSPSRAWNIRVGPWRDGAKSLYPIGLVLWDNNHLHDGVGVILSAL